jgi:O-antigen ligase
MSTKAIQNILIGLIFATLLVPLIVIDNLYFPYIVGKAAVFRLIVLISVLLYSWLIYRDNSFLPTKNKVLMSFGALNVVYLVSALFGADARESIFSGFERMDGWITTVLIFVFFVIIASVIKEKKIWNWFFVTQISISAFLFLGSISQIIDHGINHRVDTLLGNPIYLSVIFMFSVFFALYLAFEDYSKIAKNWLAVSIFTNLAGIFLTGTRGTMLAVFVSAVLMFIYFAIKFWNIKKIRFVVLSLSLLAILIPILLFSFKDSNFVKTNATLNRLTQINITEGSGYARFINWGIALQGIKEKPIIGWGQNNYSYVFDKHFDPRMYGQEPFFDRAHNIILDTTIHGGVLALIAFVLIFVYAISSLFKNNEIRIEQKVILSSLFLAYFIQNLFVFDNITSYLLFVYLLSFCVYYKKDKINIQTKNLIIPAIVFVFVIITFLYAVVFPIKSNLNLLNGMQLTSANKDGSRSLTHKNGIADNKMYFEKALKWNFVGIQEIKITALNTSNAIRSLQTSDVKIQKDISDFVNFVNYEIRKESDRKPQSARMKYFAGIFSSNIGDFDNAEKYLKESIDIAPNRQLYLEGLLTVKKILNKQEEYVALIKNIYELAPDNDIIWAEYGNVLAQTDKEKYETFLKETANDSRIENVLKIFDGAIKNSPENPQVYVNKGVFLSKIGRIDESIKIFEDLKIKFPTLSKQLDAWIKDLKSGKIPV